MGYAQTWIIGAEFICLEAGLAKSLTAYIAANQGQGGNAKFAIHKVSDKSLVGYTEEGTIPNLFDGWKKLNIVSGGILTPNTHYWLDLWFSTVMMFYREPLYPYDMVYEVRTYNGFPDPWAGVGIFDVGYKLSIFCTYAKKARTVMDGLVFIKA